MPSCYLCKKDVTSGYVVCGECVGELKNNGLPHVLDDYIAMLALNIVSDNTVYPCSMCEYKDCAPGNSEITRNECHKGVSSWLRSRANEFAASGTGILGKLKTVCPFPEVFEDIDDVDSLNRGVPRREIGHIRADYNNYRWWNTVWPAHEDLATAEIKAEIDRTYEALTANNALYDLNVLRRFCWLHPEAQASPKADDEFSFYLVGETCDFRVQFITRDLDYNMYLTAYAKAESDREVD